MKTYYLQGNQSMDCHMIDAQDEDGVYCKTEDAKAEINELKQLNKVHVNARINKEKRIEKLQAEVNKMKAQAL